MSDMTDCKLPPGGESGVIVLPTRQRNALRLLLNKASFSPQEIAALDIRVIERAPGIGRKSLDLINAWLKSHGCELSGAPRATLGNRQIQKQRKLQQAIDLLRGSGYEIHRSR